ncbi:MAG: hypothetical protein HGGPFJEG_00712 [Ignavibacteria bacterium]|nr:hypothetical protein [Ignavibacteria bacterium]
MKKNNQSENLERTERLREENNLLRMKLTAEFGMRHSGSNLDEELENEWLKYIYNFEKSYADSKRVKIYDFIGKPDFRKIEEVKDSEIESELNKLFALLYKNNIVLNCLCDYEDKVIYKFITEELFEIETDDIRIKGLNHCFIYEEFHPNHEYDLKNYSEELFIKLYDGSWDEEFDKYRLCNKITVNNIFLCQSDFTKLVSDFHKANSYFKIENVLFENVKFDLSSGKAEVSGIVTVKLNDSFNMPNRYDESFKIYFEINDFGYWDICSIEFEALTVTGKWQV